MQVKHTVVYFFTQICYHDRNLSRFHFRLFLIMKKPEEDHEVSFTSNSGWRVSKKLGLLLAAVGALSCVAVGLIVFYVGVSKIRCDGAIEIGHVLPEMPTVTVKPADHAEPSKVYFRNKQARVAQLVARRVAVPEIRVQTPPGAN